MQIGYPCINRTLKCTSSSTFRLASYTPERFRATAQNNMACLSEILRWNVEHNIFFFRISSQLIPFASHSVCTYPWQEEFSSQLREIGDFIKLHNIRISMHPDQFVLINSVSEEIFERSVKELQYHATVLNLIQLDNSHKIQIHVGGVYGDKQLSIKRFVDRYKSLPETIQERLVIENDDRLFSLRDCLHLHKRTGIPVLFDTFHHEIYNNGESMGDALVMAAKTWKTVDGVPMIDYSSQEAGARKGNHAKQLDASHFTEFLKHTKSLSLDIMLEIKDKEENALTAINIIKQ